MSSRPARKAAFLLPLVLVLSSCKFEGQEVREEDTDCQYRLPFPSSLGEVRVTQGISDEDNLSHQPGELEEYAIDFALVEGTPVLAARGGEVSQTHDGETLFGNESFARYANFVIVDHGDGSYALYAHLRDVAVEKGQAVQQGQLLGHSGRTGWTNGKYHLHFQLQERGDKVGQSILPCFAEVEGGIPQLNQRYVSQNQTIMVQGMQVTKKPSAEEYTDLLGIWEGQISESIDGNLQSRILTVEISSCDSIANESFSGQFPGKICVAFLDLFEPNASPLVGGDRPGYCFGNGYNIHCFAPAGKETLNYQGHGPQWTAEGILHRSGGIPEGAASILGQVQRALENKDISIFESLLPAEVCAGNGTVGECRISRTEFLEQIRIRFAQSSPVCLSYYFGGGGETNASWLVIFTTGWLPEWPYSLHDGGNLKFSFSNAWAVQLDSRYNIVGVTSQELRFNHATWGRTDGGTFPCP